MMRTSFPGLKTVGAEYTDEQFGVVLARSERRPAARGQRRAVADPGQRRIREDLHQVVRRERRARHRRRRRRARSTPASSRGRGPFFLRGVWMTAVMAVSSLLLGLPLGLCLALARVQSSRFVSAPAAVYVEVMRGTPLLVQILFVYFVLPSVGINLPAYASGILALTLNAAAYISEVIRAGILSIDAGPDGSGARARHELLAGDAPHHPAADVPPRRPAADQRRHRAAEGLVAGVGDRPDRAGAHRPGAGEPLRGAADDLAARRAALPRADVPADARRGVSRAALAAGRREHRTS